jgi:hypothetical protein
MTGEHDGQVPTARCCKEAMDDGRTMWTVSKWPGSVSTGNQAITAMVLAEQIADRCGDHDPFVIRWREELGVMKRPHLEH